MFLQTPCRIPHNKKLTTLSPQKVIAHSVSAIPDAATHVVLILYDLQEFIDTPFTLSLTIKSLSLQNFSETFPPFTNPLTLTHLTTGF
jgi:hypothetical protein